MQLAAAFQWQGVDFRSLCGQRPVSLPWPGIGNLQAGFILRDCRTEIAACSILVTPEFQSLGVALANGLSRGVNQIGHHII